MIQDVRLFIGDKEVEFSSTPQILFNYTLKEVQNPTIVRNSFTKSIDIPSTPENDDIFNHYWNLERYQDDLSFNPIVKIPFQLFLNGALNERGYCKLDGIKMKNNQASYSVSLYGGLGSFFYALSYDETSGSSTKKNLSSLQYITDTIRTEPDLNFRINKETVKEAWDGIMGQAVYDDKWNVINFVPAYNGFPDDFDAAKCLINYADMGNVFSSAVTDGGETYTTYRGYALGESKSDLTEWETFDLRSYLQRPAINVQRVLQACFQPSNNGGYQVKTDNHFFNLDNPYWTNGWCTLKSFKDMEIAQGESETVTGANIQYISGGTWVSYWGINYNPPTLSAINNARMKLSLRFTPMTSTSASKLYGNRTLNVNTGAHIFDGHKWVKTSIGNTGVIIQLQALDLMGNVVAESDAYLLAGSKTLADGTSTLYTKFGSDGNEPSNYHFIKGAWVRSGSYYQFCDDANNPVSIEFNLNTDAQYNSLRIKTQWPDSQYTKYAWSGNASLLNSPTWSNAYLPLYTTTTDTVSGDYTTTQARDVDAVRGQFSYNIDSMELISVDYEALFSNTYIPRNKLLAGDITPCDFLLSYAKMFGLYFYVDPAEQADDPVAAPNGVIHIMDRDTYYDEEHIDITERIDRGKDMKITPVTAQSKWYEFKQEQIDSEAATVYEDNYGRSYGSQMVDTNYNFDADVKNLYDGNAFQSGIMVREKSKYYYQPINGVPSYVWNGFTYSLFNGSNNHQIEMEVIRIPNKFSINVLGLAGYDSFPKLQCHTEDNSPSDGSGVLLFYKGAVTTMGEGGPVIYRLTDDLEEMAALNDGTACWIMTNSDYNTGGTRIAFSYSGLPQFTRDMINFGLQEGNVVNSWNFGHPQAIYVPNTYTTDGDSIYDKCWKDYIKDFYDVNTRIVSCYVRIPRQAQPALFRKWWHFDNGIYALNSIKDWNLAKDEPVLCEFIKVQDTENYSLQQINGTGEEHFVINTYEIGCSGGTISGTIYLQSGGHWYSRNDTGMAKVTDANGVVSYVNGVLSPYQGQGTTSYVTLTIPANTGDTALVWEVAVIDDYDNWISVSLTQYSCGSSLAFVPSTYRRNASGGTMMLTFEAENMIMSSLSVSKDASWLGTPTISGDSRVIITNERNDTTSQRIGYVTLEGYGYNGRQYSASAAIVQSGQEYEPGWIEFSNTALTIPYQSGITDESFSYGGSLEMSDLRVYGGDGWATPRIVSATSEVFVDYTENAGASARTAYITIYGYDKLGVRRTAHLQLTQNAQPQQTIFVSPTEINMTYANMYGDNLTITGTTGDYNITITDNA